MHLLILYKKIREKCLKMSENVQPQVKKRKLNRSQLKQLAESNWVPPDGGWGWAIVVGCFFTFALLVGMSRSFGIIYHDVEDAFAGTKNVILVMIPSMTVTLTVGLGVVAGALSVAFSCRSVAFVGGFLAGLGLSLNYFAMNAYYMMFCFLIAGFGAGLATNVGIIIVAKYFRKNRSLAVGLSFAGTGVGSMLQPPLVKFLATKYGFRGALLIQGGMMFHVCAGVLLYRDPISKKKLKILAAKLAQQENNADTKTKESGFVEEKESHTSSQTTYQKGVDGRYSTTKSNFIFRWVERYLYLDLTVLYSPIFVMFCLSCMFLAVGYPQALIIAPPHVEILGYSQYSGSILVSISSGGDLLGRVVFGFLYDRKVIGKQMGYIGGITLLCFAMLWIAFTENYYEIVAAIFLYGVFAGSSFILIPVLLSEYLGPAKLPSTFGMSRTCMAVATLLTPPLVGHIRDLTGNFKASLATIAGITSLGSVCAILLIPIKQRYKARAAHTVPTDQEEIITN